MRHQVPGLEGPFNKCLSGGQFGFVDSICRHACAPRGPSVTVGGSTKVDKAKEYPPAF